MVTSMVSAGKCKQMKDWYKADGPKKNNQLG